MTTPRALAASTALACFAGAAFAQAPGAIPLDPTLFGDETAPRDLLRAVLEPYAHAIASLGFWALLSIALIPLSVAGKAKARSDSGHPVRDYSDPVYRRHRALQNAIETSGPFVAATVAAVLAGAPAFWVNLLASVFVIARFSTAIFHVVTENQMARSATWAVGMLCLIGLTGLAIHAAMNL